MARRDRLGKGLGALLGEYLEPEADEVGTRRIPVSSILPNPYQPRREFAEEELEDLCTSIRENGLLQPVVVRPGGKGRSSSWELVAGERRWRAVTRLGWPDVPAIIREVDDRTLLVLALVENLQRSQLSALEEAQAFQQLVDEFSFSQQQIAETVGRDRSTVANTLRLLQLPPAVRRLVQEGGLTAGHARALLALTDERKMADLARRVIDEGWSVRQVETEVQRTRQKGRSRPTPARVDRGAAERRLEEELQRTLGTEARIRHGRGAKGRIEIPYYDAEDFDRLYELLTGQQPSDLV